MGPDPRVVAEQIARQLFSHPLAQRYALRVNASGDSCVYSAADVLGERLVRLGGILAAALEPGLLRTNLRPERALDDLLAVTQVALQAPAYLWTEEVRIAIGASQSGDDGHLSLPRHVVSPRILPAPRMWWTFERAIAITMLDLDGQDAAIDSVLVNDSTDGLEIVTIGEIDEGAGPRPMLEGLRFLYGQTYPDDLKDHPGRTALESILSLLAFLNSPYIPKTRQRLNRAERREISRTQAPDLADEITFVMLRRPEPNRQTGEKSTASVDWQHRWIVSGHYRAQWYPSEAAHHVIWIAPYLKGPDEAPLVEHAYRVAR